MSDPAPGPETTHRGVRWRRESGGQISFFDADGDRWVTWGRGVDAPPRPPGWAPEGGRPPRPGWRTPWRMVPLALTVVAVLIAIVQVLRPSGSAVGREKAAAAALLGQCLAQHGTSGGHPRYTSKPVPCDSAQASVRVTRVIPSGPGGGACPDGTSPVELAYLGVRYPHIECVVSVHQGGSS